MLGAGSSAVSLAKALPPTDAPIMLSDFTNYRLGPLDLVSIEVFGAPTLMREGEVDAAGNLAVPLVGTVAAGRMPYPQIYANDIVVVGENATRRLLKDINNIPILGSFGRFIP